MLLRRVIEHVTAQNWLAVGLDLAVVVIGVFIGFQVTAWNESRLLADDEARALIRLHAESQEIVRYFQKLVQRHDKANGRRKHALAALAAGTQEGFNPDDMKRGIFSLSHYPAISPKRSTYDDLSASGLFGKISNGAVRESVAAYYAELGFIQSQLDFFRQNVGEIRKSAGLALRREYVPEGDPNIIRRMDFDALARNQSFLSAATDALRNQFVFQFYRRKALAAAENMCRDLSRAIGDKCAPLAKEGAP